MASPFESFKKVNNFEYENSNLYVNFAENVNQQANQRVLQTMQKSTSPQSMSAKATARRTFNDTNKVFIGGISHSTTEETLHAYFSKFGQLIDCVIIKDPKTNNPKGFGFVQYPESGMVDELMKNRPHTIDNRQLDVHRSIPRALAKKQEVKNRNVTKLFVAGLNHDIISESDLRTFFETFGTVLSVQIPKDKETNRLKSFAFITFDDYDPVDKIICKLMEYACYLGMFFLIFYLFCLVQKVHTINGVNVHTQKALPKDGGDNQGGGGGRGGRGGGGGHRGGRNNNFGSK